MSAKIADKEKFKKKDRGDKIFKIPYAWIWLSVLVIVVYGSSFHNGLTELDDVIFIHENMEYNKDVSNLITSFNRGVFALKKDTYYRPLLLNSFLINYQISKDNITTYHIVNILLHLISVVLLFYLLIKLKLPELHAFLLAALFAVHPVLSQAVSWIPGRNDTLLAVFTFGFMITNINYLDNRKWSILIIGFVLLLAALLTKESALFIPFGFFFILLMFRLFKWREKRNIIMYSSWLIAIILWAFLRTTAGLDSESYSISVIASNFIKRVPVLIQYFGKAILPFNLSVFPMMEDTSYVYGFVAIILIALFIYFARKSNMRIIIAGVVWFLIMLLPVVLLPGSLNQQDFEHRLYVPMLGILLVLSQTILFIKTKNLKSSLLIICIIILFAGINISHQEKFNDPVTFWEAAVESSPNSAYASMMLAARLDESDINRANELMIRAYELNPKEKYINFYLGQMYDNKGETEQAEKYLLEELTLSSYYETYYLLSRIEFERKNINESITYMEKYLQIATDDQASINNYLLMLIETGQKQKANDFIILKQNEGILIPEELINKVK